MVIVTKFSKAKPDINPIDWDSDENMLARATAKTSPEVLTNLDIGGLAVTLSNENINSKTGEVMPVPAYLREFLARALFEIASGVDPKEALRMKLKGAKKTWSSSAKVLICSEVNDFVKKGKNNKQACKDVAEKINMIFASLNTQEKKDAAMSSHAGWVEFFGKTITEDRVKKIFADYSPQLLKARPAKKG